MVLNAFSNALVIEMKITFPFGGSGNI